MAGQVEMMDQVAEMIAIGSQTRTRLDREIKPDAVLCGFGSRLHAQLHEALADRCAVTEFS